MTRPSIPRIESIGDIGIHSIKQVSSQKQFNECRLSPLYDEEPRCSMRAMRSMVSIVEY